MMCSIPDCERAAKHRGWCGMHYQRWQKYGDPLVNKNPVHTGPLLERLIARIDVGDCWEWNAGAGQRANGRYGVLDFQNKTLYAHRAMWMALVGPIPDGLTLDHLCRNTLCVNPDHLELVTVGENVLRGEAPGIRKYRKRKGLTQQLRPDVRREGAPPRPPQSGPHAPSRRTWGRVT